MKGRRRRAHHDRAGFERNFIRKLEHVSRGNLGGFRIPAVSMSADHLHAPAELFETAAAKLAVATVY